MAKNKKKVNSAQKKEWAWGYLFVLPNLIGFAVFFVLPVIYGLVISLTDYNGFKQFNFLGLKNYINLFSDKFFLIALKNNIFYSIVFVPLTIFLALILALALNKPKKLNGLFKTVFYFPFVIPLRLKALSFQPCMRHTFHHIFLRKDIDDNDRNHGTHCGSHGKPILHAVFGLKCFQPQLYCIQRFVLQIKHGSHVIIPGSLECKNCQRCKPRL